MAFFAACGPYWPLATDFLWPFIAGSSQLSCVNLFINLFFGTFSHDRLLVMRKRLLVLLEI